MPVPHRLAEPAHPTHWLISTQVVAFQDPESGLWWQVLDAPNNERNYVETCVEMNQCVACTQKFFTKSFRGDDAAVLAPSSGEESTPPRRRAGVASLARRS